MKHKELAFLKTFLCLCMGWLLSASLAYAQEDTAEDSDYQEVEEATEEAAGGDEETQQETEATEAEDTGEEATEDIGFEVEKLYENTAGEVEVYEHTTGEDWGEFEGLDPCDKLRKDGVTFYQCESSVQTFSVVLERLSPYDFEAFSRVMTEGGDADDVLAGVGLQLAKEEDYLQITGFLNKPTDLELGDRILAVRSLTDPESEWSYVRFFDFGDDSDTVLKQTREFFGGPLGSDIELLVERVSVNVTAVKEGSEDNMSSSPMPNAPMPKDMPHPGDFLTDLHKKLKSIKQFKHSHSYSSDSWGDKPWNGKNSVCLVFPTPKAYGDAYDSKRYMPRLSSSLEDYSGDKVYDGGEVKRSRDSVDAYSTDDSSATTDDASPYRGKKGKYLYPQEHYDRMEAGAQFLVKEFLKNVLDDKDVHSIKLHRKKGGAFLCAYRYE